PAADPSARAGVVADAQATVGAAAPDFSLTDVEGTPFDLSAQKGKVVVLEWFNPDCPFVKHAYQEGPLADLAGRWIDRGVMWVAINSGKPGKQGAGAERNRAARTEYRMASPVLLDESGAVGRLYGAVTTPQIYVIDTNGVLVYNGALDDQPLGRGSGPARVYADEVLAAVTTGKPAPFGKQKPYGCSVKY
ncbi:MAG: redoxin domain-containing protein, partial [Myxococcota bacterium]|nr:redoxin domain-containing protein [Myxococcota bacterium]